MFKIQIRLPPQKEEFVNIAKCTSSFIVSLCYSFVSKIVYSYVCFPKFICLHLEGSLNVRLLPVFNRFILG